MLRARYLIAVFIATSFAPSAPVSSQTAASGPGHLIIVKLVTRGGSVPYGFEPASVTAQHGDTVRFVEDDTVMHNVHFKTHPAGARLGAATVSPYLTAKGQTYDVVIDARFTDGKYEFVCDPHEMLGMHGVLTVGDRAAVGKTEGGSL